MGSAKAKTLDGKRTAVQSINIEVPQSLQAGPEGILSRIGRAYKNLNQFMAGMYTGVGCSGTPHEDHSYQEVEKPKSKADSASI